MTKLPTTALPTFEACLRHARNTTPENQSLRDIFRPCDLPNPSTSTYHNPPIS